MEKWEYSAEERLTELNLTCIQVTSGDSEALVVSAAGRVVTLQLYVPHLFTLPLSYIERKRVREGRRLIFCSQT